MASVANGGSADDIAPGVDFFKELNDAGNLLPVDPTSATIESGQTPVVIDWDYLNAAEAAKIDTWEQVVPSEAVIGGLLLPGHQRRRPAPGGGSALAGVPLQRRGPEPLAQGRCPPVRADAMVEAGTIDQALYDALPPVEGEPIIPTNEQTAEHGRLPGGQLGKGRRLSVTAPVARPPAHRLHRPDRQGRRFDVGPAVGLLPFLAFVLIFLIVPTITVAIGAFQDEDGRLLAGEGPRARR